MDSCVRRVHLVIIDHESSEAVEKWNFDVESEVDMKIEDQVSPKSLVKVQREIQDVLRQTSGTVSFLPSLPDDCCFEIHVVLYPGTKIPPGWKRCKNATVKNGEEFAMLSFSTGLQKVRTSIISKPTIKT